MLHAGEPVARDTLIDALWEERPPPTVATALNGYVLQLRKVLEPGRRTGDAPSVLVTREPGYVLLAAPEQIDAERFRRLAADGRARLDGGDPGEAAPLLREALALWRGPALADLSGESFAAAYGARLDGERAAALEDRIDADLELGRHAAVVGELEALVVAEPLRERPRAQLMLALYRCGRQAESLAAYRAARRTLVEEIGIEPGSELRDLERRVLAQDPALELGRPVRVRPGPGQTRPRRRWVLAAGVL
ncbi:MAG: hypothetical protein QOJ22_304, partial [Thermoleophilaceae bacterium]|nr:hypothetical protein [Thermoleophilaceae bacterium]